MCSGLTRTLKCHFRKENSVQHIQLTTVVICYLHKGIYLLNGNKHCLNFQIIVSK